MYSIDLFISQNSEHNIFSDLLVYYKTLINIIYIFQMNSSPKPKSSKSKLAFLIIGIILLIGAIIWLISYLIKSNKENFTLYPKHDHEPQT